MRRIVLICAGALLLASESHAIEPGAPFVMQGDVLRGTCGPTPSVIGQYDGETIASCKAASFTTVAEDLQLECDMSDDETATLRSAIEGGAAAGTSTFVRSGCRILLGTPGAGDSVAAFPSNTTIYCEDKTAGFVLATKHCSGASDAPGAACTADNQCNNGTCVADADAGTAFAPTEGSTYTGFSAATGAKDIAIINCSIWAQGASGSPAALGGADKQWGYCNGAGTSVAGEACAKVCDATASPSILEGLACTSDTGCGSVAGSCDVIAGDCTTLGGACGAVPYATNFAPVGPGKVNPIDFSNATNARIENVTVYDHRRGDFTFRTGVAGAVVDSQTDGRTLLVPITGSSLFNYPINASVAKGIIANADASITRSRGTGWEAGIEAEGFNLLVGATGAALGAPSESGWNGTTGLLISSAGVRAYGFIGDGGLNCVRPKFGQSSGGGYNFIVSNPYCDGQIGPKFIIQSAGNQYLGIRGAWDGRGSVIGLGDQRGRCSGGSRSGLVCVFGSGTDSTIGCPSSSCAAHDDFPADGAGHFIVSGGGLLHTDQTGVSFMRAADSKRCNGGSDPGTPCTADGDCNGGVSGQCRPLRYTDALITSVNFFNPFSNANTAIEIDTTSIGVHPNTVALGGGPSIENWLVDGLFRGFATGIEFPTNSKFCVGGSSAGTSCTADSTCTSGGGLCEPPVKRFVATGNMANVTAPLVGWDWEFGDVSGLKGLLPADDQGEVVTLTAGAALTRGQLVSASTAADNTVIVTTTANPERAVGVALGTALSGDHAKVLTSGVGICIADGTITRGDKLKPSGSTDGRVVTVSGSSDLIVGSALASTTSGNTFDCLIGTTPPIQNTTASFPKFANDEESGAVGLATCTTFTEVLSIAHSTTTGRKVRLIATYALDHTATGTRTVDAKFMRGGTGCSDATLIGQALAGSALAANENSPSSAQSVTENTPGTGSQTYRFCACASAASVEVEPGASMLLTEY